MGADLHNTERELEDRERGVSRRGGSDERTHGGMRRAQAVCLGVDSMETKRLQ